MKNKRLLPITATTIALSSIVMSTSALAISDCMDAEIEAYTECVNDNGIDPAISCYVDVAPGFYSDESEVYVTVDNANTGYSETYFYDTCEA